MNDEKIFVDGMIVKRNENAPDFVICNLSLKRKELLISCEVTTRMGG